MKWKSKEDLVYNKNGGEVIGFVNMGNFNDQFLELEKACKAEKPQHPKIAKQMLVFVVRGIFNNLEFPYTHFPTTDITSHCIKTLAWEAIRQLEFCGLKVIAVTCDWCIHKSHVHQSTSIIGWGQEEAVWQGSKSLQQEGKMGVLCVRCATSNQDDSQLLEESMSAQGSETFQIIIHTWDQTNRDMKPKWQTECKEDWLSLWLIRLYLCKYLTD